ncbi:putative P450 monooxygenase [Myriangium duriaei CBS 260.36]|uniref:P450 monooxygenase n=1 Tax=Myriangium duriaei CBS 260.36 TaxID=1168546 RepID=A0A9P4J3J1_9PEZI|nr:putative P450 monooxygenase [Myriangium duriaei CBS 260.36]
MDHLLHSEHSFLAVVGAAAALYVVFKIVDAVYAVFFHPLHKIPGPWWAAISRVPYARHLINGTTHSYLTSLHSRYGPVVRYSPNEVSFTQGEEAWQQIYGFRTGKQRGTQTFEKDLVWYAPGIDGIPSMILAPDLVHGRQRRIISHAFSEKSLRDQEWLIQKHANLLVSRIKETDVAEGKITDLQHWFTLITFDIISELTFGSGGFGCLTNNTSLRYVETLLGGFKAFAVYYCARYWPLLKSLYDTVVGPPKTIKMRMEWIGYLKDKISSRIETETAGHDFMTDILSKISDEEAKGNEGISKAELMSNAQLFMAAGTETTATVLQCTAYLVLQHPEVYKQLCEEVRSRFKSQDEITIEAANSLTYTIAVLTEAMRFLPPVPAGFPRKVPSSGAEVCGYWIPGNCNASVSVTQYSSYRDPANFRDPLKFAPERWLGDPRYEKDNHATFSPFSFGPRNCLGKNLAYAEMRVIFSKVIYNFDLQLHDSGMDDWMERCRVAAIWSKPPLLVKMTPVN